MGDFKRNSSRFSRGGGSGGDGGGSSRSGGGRSFSRGRDSGGGGEEQQDNGRRGGGGGYSGRSGGRGNGGGGGGQGDFPFTRIASLTIPKSATDDAADFIEKELKDSEITLNAKIFLGKGDNELTLKNGDMVIVRFKTSRKDPEYVVGALSVKN